MLPPGSQVSFHPSENVPRVSMFASGVLQRTSISFRVSQHHNPDQNEAVLEAKTIPARLTDLRRIYNR